MEVRRVNHLGHAVGRHDREISNLVRIGVVSAIQGNQARVAIGNTVTNWLYWASRRAYDAFDYDSLTVGEQVIVLSLWGDVSQGVIVGAVPQDAQVAPASGNVWGKRFKDGSTITYDPDSHALLVQAGSSPITIKCQSANVQATDSVTLDTPKVHVTGTLTVDKDVSVGGSVTAQGDVMGGGKSLDGHVHPIASSSITGPPK